MVTPDRSEKAPGKWNKGHSPKATREIPGNRSTGHFAHSWKYLPARFSEKRWCISRETPAFHQRIANGSHLLREERRIEEVPPPSPAHSGDAEKSKDSPDEDEPDPPLKWAVAVFTGAMNDLGDYLFDTSKPPNPRFANGGADWAEFGFNSIAVEAATRQGNAWALVLSARDPAAARRGLEKYRRKWNESLGKWFGCEVYFELRDAAREKRPNAKKC